MSNIWGLGWPFIPFPQDLLFPWESGVGILKAPPQFAGVAGERTATFWQLKEATRSTKPTRKNCAARSGNARVLGVGCARQLLPATLACSPALFGSSALRLIVKLSGCPYSPLLLRTTLGARVPLCSHRRPTLERPRPRVQGLLCLGIWPSC